MQTTVVYPLLAAKISNFFHSEFCKLSISLGLRKQTFFFFFNLNFEFLERQFTLTGGEDPALTTKETFLGAD